MGTNLVGPVPLGSLAYSSEHSIRGCSPSEKLPVITFVTADLALISFSLKPCTSVGFAWVVRAYSSVKKDFTSTSALKGVKNMLPSSFSDAMSRNFLR